MRNKILSIILIVLTVQFLIPVLALAEDSLVTEEPTITEQNLEVEPIMTIMEISEPALLAEVVEEPFKLPSNDLCLGISGDLNGDGLINEYDNEVMTQMIKGLEPFDPCADLDGDGYISGGDLSILMNLYKIDLPAHPEMIEELAEIKEENDAAKAVISGAGICTLGDTNVDNKIDYKDRGLLIQMMKGELPGALSADLDGDGYIGPGDMDMIDTMIKITHKESSDVTASEAGNCEMPTANLFYSKDGVNYTQYIEVGKSDNLKIKAVFSSDLKEYDQVLINIDNGLSAESPMTKENSLETSFDLIIDKESDLTASVSVKIVNGIFSNDINIVNGKSFDIKNTKSEYFGSGTFGGSLPVCEFVDYSDWSEPVDGKISRTIISKTPYDCVLTSEQEADMEKISESEEKTVEIPVVVALILGEKMYADGTLLRAIITVEIYVIENGYKRHIKTLNELAEKYFGVEILNVTSETLDSYPTII